MKKALLFVVLLALVLAGCSSDDNSSDSEPETKPVVDDGLPVIVPELAEESWTRNAITFEQLHNVNEESGELVIDLGDPDISGEIHIGPYPFEAGDSNYDYIRYRRSAELSEGRAVLPLSRLYTASYDSNGWIEGGDSTATPTVAYRLELFQGEDTSLGMYGSFASFEAAGEGVFRKMPTIIDGPYVTLLSSDDPTSMEIVWETDEPCSGRVSFGSQTYDQGNGESTEHSVKISGLTPNTAYEYAVESVSEDGRKVTSKTYTVRSAPEKGDGPVVFAFASDCRTGGVGGGERDYMGVNLYVLNQITASAYRKGAEFFLFGGDMVYGYSTDSKDFALQLKAWKQGMAGFWRTRPVYSGMGNHEVGMNMYGGMEVILDKWPYSTDSGEAVFADEMFNPTNGPAVSDSRRPSYQENVYQFQYGPVLVMSLNNTYWMTGFTTEYAKTYGGAPVGYIMDDQLDWLETSIENAEKDPTVKFIFLFTHSPVFPTMKHIYGAMWCGGDNNVRAYTKNKDSGKVEPEALGIVEVRNRMWKALAQSSKVAAVFTGDEHAYHRTLISSTTPVGVYPDDDTDGDGVLDKYSPNPEFTHPVWHITCGGGGAPYVANVESAPWTPETVSSHIGYVLIRAEGDKASLEFVTNPAGAIGEVADEVADLMAVK